MTERVKELFEISERELFISRLKFTFFYLATPLVLGFLAVDAVYCPDLVGHFFAVRLSVIPVSISCYLMYRLRLFSSPTNYTVPGHIFSFYLGVLNSYLAYRTGGAQSMYYAGINLVAIGALSFVPWNWQQMALNAALIFTPFVFAAIYFVSQNTMNLFFTQLSFVLSTLFLGGVTSVMFRKLRVNEFEARQKLQLEIQSKEVQIKRQTEQGIFLEKLAMQFSPQVIEGVKHGTINLDEIKRKEVSCIFVDVVNSTDRSGRIDHKDFADVLSSFFGDLVNVFLTHDVTVGTYLGDGMLAFVNAPNSNPQHRQTALNACLAVLRSHASKQHYYQSKWHREFSIRIGINSGYSQVGFFPNLKHGTYTVIGDSVNLTSRLCQRAKPNSICVTKQFLLECPGVFETVEIQSLGRAADIKGFEGETYELISVTPKIDAMDHTHGNCPQCANRMLETPVGDGNIYLQCNNCGYKDLIEAPEVTNATARKRAA